MAGRPLRRRAQSQSAARPMALLPRIFQLSNTQSKPTFLSLKIRIRFRLMLLISSNMAGADTMGLALMKILVPYGALPQPEFKDFRQGRLLIHFLPSPFPVTPQLIHGL